MGLLSPTAPALIQSHHPALSANLQSPSGLLLFFLLGSNPVFMWQPELSLERCKSCHSLLKALQWLSPLGFKKIQTPLVQQALPALAHVCQGDLRQDCPVLTPGRKPPHSISSKAPGLPILSNSLPASSVPTSLCLLVSEVFALCHLPRGAC